MLYVSRTRTVRLYLKKQAFQQYFGGAFYDKDVAKNVYFRTVKELVTTDSVEEAAKIARDMELRFAHDPYNDVRITEEPPKDSVTRYRGSRPVTLEYEADILSACK